MIEPVDDAERRLLLAELVAERFGPRPWRPGMEELPRVLAARRRVLVGVEKQEEAGAA